MTEVVERIEVVLATDDVAEVVVFCTKADVDIVEVVEGRSLVDVEEIIEDEVVTITAEDVDVVLKAEVVVMAMDVVAKDVVLTSPPTFPMFPRPPSWGARLRIMRPCWRA